MLQFFFFKRVKITMGCGTAKPVDCFLQLAVSIGQFAGKMGRITTLGPAFSQVRPDGTRRTTNLINECKLLIIRPAFVFSKYRLIHKQAS